MAKSKYIAFLLMFADTIAQLAFVVICICIVIVILRDHSERCAYLSC